MKRFTVIIKDKVGAVTPHLTYGESAETVRVLWSYLGCNHPKQPANPYPYTVLEVRQRIGN